MIALSAPTSTVNLFGSLVLVHAARLATDESLIDFYLASQFAAPALHCQPDAMQHEPSGFLSYADGAVNLPRANPVLAIGNHPDSRKPLVQSERRVLKDSSDLYAELEFRMASFALPETARGYEGNLFASASRARDAIGPSARHQIVQAIVGIGEIDDRFLKAFGFGCHDQILAERV